MNYCVYLTTYLGNKLPMFYIGSSNVDRVNNGYHGSVLSKKYQSIWLEELKNNPNLFKTKIISQYKTRKEALEREKELHLKLNVAKSLMYINMSIASDKGYYGLGLSGKDHPLYGMEPWNKGKKCSNISLACKGRVPWNKGKTNIYSKSTLKKMSDSRKGFKLSNEHYDKLLQSHSIPKSNETKSKISQAHIGKLKGPQVKCSCVICKRMVGSSRLTRHTCVTK